MNLFLYEQPHVRIWDTMNLNTLHVIGIGDFDKAVSCLSFSKLVRQQGTWSMYLSNAVVRGSTDVSVAQEISEYFSGISTELLISQIFLLFICTLYSFTDLDCSIMIYINVLSFSFILQDLLSI